MSVSAEEKQIVWAAAGTASPAVTVPTAALEGVYFFHPALDNEATTLYASRDTFTTEYAVWNIDVETAEAVLLPNPDAVAAVNMSNIISGLQGQQIRWGTGSAATASAAATCWWEFVYDFS